MLAAEPGAVKQVGSLMFGIISGFILLKIQP